MGYGWGPFMGSQVNVSNSQQGTLFIDIIETNNKELIWQGVWKRISDCQCQQKRRINTFFCDFYLGKLPSRNKG